MLKNIFIFGMSLCTICVAAKKPKVVKPPLQTIIIDPGHGGVDQGAGGSKSTEAENALAISFKVRELLKKQIPELKVLMTREKNELAGGGTKKESLHYIANFANANKADLFVSIHLNSTNVRYERRLEGYRTETYTVTTGKGKKKKKTTKTREVPIYVRYRSENQATGTQTYIWAANNYVNGTKESAVGRNTAEDEGIDSSFQTELSSVEAKIRANLYTKAFFNKSKKLAEMVEEEFAKVGRKSWGVMQRNEKSIWVLQATGMPSILVETGFISDLKEEDYLSSEQGQTETAQCVVNAIIRYKQNLEAAQKHAEDLRANSDSLPTQSMIKNVGSGN